MATKTQEIAELSDVNFDPHAVRRGVWSVRRNERREIGWTERRPRRTIPIRRPVYLTPVVMEDGALCSPKPDRACTLAYTTEVSTRGICFTHEEPPPTQHAIVTFGREDEEPVSLVIEMEWSYGCADRWYSSGGKFIAATETPEFLRNPPNTEPRGPTDAA